MSMRVVCHAVLLLAVLVIGQQLPMLVSGAECQDLHAYLLLNTSEGAKFTHQSSRSEDPQTTIFVGEYIPPECGANFQRCNVTVTTENQRTVALISLIRGVGLVLYNRMSSGLQYLNHHVLDIPENLHCRMTAMFPLRDERYILGLCLNLTQPQDDNIQHLLVSVNFTDITSSVLYQDNGRYSAERLFEPSLFSEFVYAPDAHCVVDDSYHIYSVDVGYVLDFRKESSSDGFTYHEYCINHHGCSHAKRLMLLSRNTLAVYCPNETTILYDVCSTPTITTPQSCQVGQLSLNELEVFQASVSGTPYFCSEETYVLHKDNTLTIYKDMTNWTIPLLTPPTDRIINASCSQVGNETFFLSYWESGQIFLTRVTENVTNLIGRNTLVSNIPPKIFQRRYAVMNNRSESLVFNLSCTAPQIHVRHPYHLATVVVAETTHVCECTQQIAVSFNDGTTEPPAGTSSSTAETTGGISSSTAETTGGISSNNNETTEPLTESSSSTATTLSMTVNTSTLSVVSPGQALVVGATVSTGVVLFAIFVCLAVIGVIIGSIYYCRRPKRLHQRIPSHVSIPGEIEMSERPRSLQRARSAPPSPCLTSPIHGEPNRRISYTFGQDPPATQMLLFTHPPRTANADGVHEEELRSNMPSCQQSSEVSLSDLQSASERGQLYNSRQSIDTEFPVNSSCVPDNTPHLQTSEDSLRMSASQYSELHSISENGQHQSIGTDFTVNSIPVSALAQPGHCRQDGVVTGNNLPWSPEFIHTDDIRRQHRENCNERAFKTNKLHQDFSQM